MNRRNRQLRHLQAENGGVSHPFAIHYVSDSFKEANSYDH